MIFDVNALESYLAQRGTGRLTASPPPASRPTLREPLMNQVR